MNITIKIDAPELIGAINNLASALANSDVLNSPAKEQDKEPAMIGTAKLKGVKEAPVKEEPDPASEEVEEKQEAAESNVTLADIRPLLASATKEGLKDKVKDILNHFGAAKLSEVQESDYPALLEEVKKLS